MQVLNTAKANETTVVYNSREFCDTILQRLYEYICGSFKIMDGPVEALIAPKDKTRTNTSSCQCQDFGCDAPFMWATCCVKTQSSRTHLVVAHLRHHLEGQRVVAVSKLRRIHKQLRGT
jgi:hypothetical protein